MTFVCYSLALGLLGLGWQWPDLTLFVVMLLLTRALTK